MSGRRRGTSDEERALFRSALEDAKPLKRLRERVIQSTRPPKMSEIRPYVPTRPIFEAPQFNEQPAPAIGGHTQAHLRRGRNEPEARFDLHGYRQENGYRALIDFLLRAHAQGTRLVLIVTGKGGVMRTQLPLWLGQAELRFLVVGVSSAHAKHGGAGAFYVTLRKKA